MSVKTTTRGPAPQQVRSQADTLPIGAPVADERAELDEARRDLDPATIAEIEANEAADLPDGVELQPDGSWLFRLQHPLEPTKSDPAGVDLEKIRIPEKVYARHVRDADRNGRGSIDIMLHLAASMCGVSPKMLERLDSRDFSTLSDLISRRAQGVPT